VPWTIGKKISKKSVCGNILAGNLLTRIKLQLTINSCFWSPGQMYSQVDVSWKLGSLTTLFGQASCALVLTCNDLSSLWSRSNLHASQCKFFTIWPPNLSQIKLCDIHQPIISQWNTGYVCLEMVFLRLVCTSEETWKSVWPPNASLYASSTCGYSQVRLARA